MYVKTNHVCKKQFLYTEITTSCICTIHNGSCLEFLLPILAFKSEKHSFLVRILQFLKLKDHQNVENLSWGSFKALYVS